MQDVSFFRASIGIILAPAPDSASFFLKMTRKGKDGSFEKFSQGQGRTVALSLQEISQALINLHGGKDFTAFHRSPSGVETRISFLSKPEDQLEIRLEDYVITLNPAERRIFSKLLEKTEDAILHQIIMMKLSRASPEVPSPVPLKESAVEATSETRPADTPAGISVDASLLDTIRENFKGGWILSKMLDKLDDLGMDISRKELLDALDLLLEDEFITKEQRTAKAGHTYILYNFPAG
jgi:hypothetical protein